MDEPIPNTARVTNNLILDSPGTYRRKARNTGVKKNGNNMQWEKYS